MTYFGFANNNNNFNLLKSIKINEKIMIKNQHFKLIMKYKRKEI